MTVDRSGCSHRLSHLLSAPLPQVRFFLRAKSVSISGSEYRTTARILNYANSGYLRTSLTKALTWAGVICQFISYHYLFRKGDLLTVHIHHHPTYVLTYHLDKKGVHKQLIPAFVVITGTQTGFSNSKFRKECWMCSHLLLLLVDSLSMQ